MVLIGRKIRYEIIRILEVKLISFFLTENVAKKSIFWEKKFLKKIITGVINKMILMIGLIIMEKK